MVNGYGSNIIHDKRIHDGRIKHKKVGYLGGIAKDYDVIKFDYWSWWRLCVKEFNISPSEAWSLDMVEIKNLINESNNPIDTSVMLNYERVKNGASKRWLQNH